MYRGRCYRIITAERRDNTTTTGGPMAACAEGTRKRILQNDLRLILVYFEEICTLLSQLAVSVTQRSLLSQRPPA